MGKGLWWRFVRVVSAIALVAAYTPLAVQPAYAATLFTGGADQNPPAFMLNDHTVYAVHFTASGLPANTPLNVTAKLSDTGVSGGFTGAPGFTWNGNNGTPRWVQQREAEASNGTMTTDGSGNLSGYVYYKVGNENFVGFPAGNGHGANQAFLTIQIYNGASATFNPSLNPIVTVLDAKTQGAWIHDGVATGAGALARAEAVSTDTATFYSLQRTEANGADDNDDGIVDNEDYGPVGASGDFRFGLKPATTVNINLGGVPWAPGQGIVTGPADTDIAVGAADQTPPSAPTTLSAVGGNNKVTLNWNASTDAGGSGLAGYTIYRKTGTQYAVQGTADASNTTALPVVVGTVGAGVTTYIDNTAVNGTTYYYHVRAKDSDTNASARSNEVSGLPLAPVPDVTPPTTTIAGVANGGFFRVPTVFSLSAVDNPGGSGVATTFYALDGTPNTYTAPVSIGSAGSHTVGYWSVDTSGNIEATKSVTFTSYLGPATTISGVPAGWVNIAPVFSLSATGDAPINSYYTLNGSANTTYTAPVTVSFQGTTTVNYWSVDGLAQTEPTRTATIKYDNVKPVTSASGITSGGIYPNPVTFSLSAVDNASGIQQTTYLIDNPGGAGGTRYTVPVVLSGLPAGAHSATYWSKDNANNTENRRTTTFTVSAGPPVTTASGIPAGWSTSTVTFSLTATGDLPPISTYYALGAGATTTYTAPVPVSTQGTTTLSFLSIDNVGQREATKTATIRVDSVAPTTISDASVVYLNSATIHLTPSDAAPGSGVTHTYYKLDGGAQTEGLTVSTTGFGPHTLEFWSVDFAGNTEVHKSASFSIDDTLAPTTTSDASVSYLDSATIHLSATDNVGGSGVAHTYHKLDGGTQAEGGTVVVSGYGSHTLEFWSVDVEGNIETPHKSTTFFIDDSIDPSTTSDAVASYVDAATIHLTATDNVGGSGVASTFYRLDGGTQTAGTTIAASGFGNHVLEFWSVDVAGNEETPHHTVNFAITSSDTTAPHTTSDAIASYVATATIHLTATDNVGGSGVAHTYYRLDSGAQTEGTTIVATGVGAHSLEFWSVDVATNIETPHHTANFAITPLIVPTTIGIRTSSGSVRRGSSFILSGLVSPQSLIGTNIQVMVKKPSRAYYSYSSLRTVYSNGGAASWWYRYTAVRTMAAGTYRFYAFVPASGSIQASQSGVVLVTIR